MVSRWRMALRLHIQTNCFDRCHLRNESRLRTSLCAGSIHSAFHRNRSAIQRVDDSRYGLQTDIFFKTLDRAFVAIRKLTVGGIIVNDVSALQQTTRRTAEES
jgi:hypothetical protein